MDYFKIFNIVFMIFTTYLLYKLYADKCYREDFEGTAQSVGGVDDTNAINTLAQIAKNLMAGGVTVPGNMTVQGNLSPAHSVWHTSTDGKGRIHYSNNSHSYYKTADAHVWRNRDEHDRMVLDHHANLRVDGGLTVQGRNILAELNNLNAKTANLNLGKFRLTDEGVALTIRNSQRGDDRRYAFYHDGNWG